MPRWIHPAWKALGIDPTSDTRAIRVAYSAKLKAIDPDRDPQAFIALREAFEAAKIQAQWVDLPDEEDEDEAVEFDEELWDEGELQPWVPLSDPYTIRPEAHLPDPVADNPDPAWQSVPEPARASPWAPITPADADAHARALATLLYSDDAQRQPWPTPEQEAEMLEHWRAIAADPRMQEVAYFADAERWFSELIARTAAFSDPLVIPATEFFGWLRSDGSIAQSPPVAYVTRRYRMLEFQQAVKQPKHPLNPAWRELVRPAGERHRRGAVNGRKVRQLLRIVRTNYPDLEGCFDAYRVALWDGTHIGTGTHGGERNGAFNWGCLWIPALIVIGMVILATVAEKMAPPRTELSQPVADIDIALQSLFGDKLDIATVGTKNPALEKALTGFWSQERDRRATHESFAYHLGFFLDRWYAYGVRNSSPELLTDYHRLMIDMARRLREADPAACQLFLANERRWNPDLKLPAELHEREKAIQIRVLLETDGIPPARSDNTKFRVPGDVFADATRRAGVGEAAMRDALLLKGPVVAQCTARIAFMETVLAMPHGKQRTEIMRNM